MGEAPVCVADALQGGIEGMILSKSDECEAKAVIGDKTYVICGGDDEVGVRVYYKATGNWVNPTVLGTRPRASKGYSVVALNEERILVIKKGSIPDDCIWFLEVQTPFVKERKEMLGTEVVAWSKGVRGNAEKPIVISGPSGVGKGTLISMLMKEFPSMFGFSVSHTTRAPREMEHDGVHYHFTEKSIMEKEIEYGKFLEFANVHGNLYGTSIEAVEVVADAGKRCILDIDVQGARSVRASPLEAIFIFICPPSMEELEKRLRARGTEKEEQILKRLRNAQAEIEQGKTSDIFDHILYNDNLEECYKNLKKLLGLDETVAATPRSLLIIDTAVGIDLPSEHSISKVDNNKIMIKCGTQDHDQNSNMIVLDVSPLKGGAPGRTRGIEVYTIDSFSDSFDTTNQSS